MTILLLTLLFSYPDSARVIGRMYYVGGISTNKGNRVIVRDSMHNIHFVYNKKYGLPYADSAEIYYRSSLDNGNTWSMEENISRTGSSTSEVPNLIIDKRNNLHCIWRQYIPNGVGVHELFYSRKDTSGWTTPQRLTYQNNTSNDVHYSSFVCDSQNRLRLVWDASVPISALREIWYSILTNESITSPYNVTNTATASTYPNLSIDTLNHLHLCNKEYVAGEYRAYYQKYDNINWTLPYLVWQLGGNSSAGTVIDTKNRIHCVLGVTLPNAQHSDIYYMCYTDSGGWSYPINISETPTISSWRCNIACDSLDNLYVVWQERLPGYTDDIYYRTFNGDNWSPVVNLTNDPNSSGIPKLGHPVTRSGVDLIWSHEVSFWPQVYDVVYMRLQPIASGIEEPEIPRQITNQPQPTMQIFPNPTRSFSNIHYSLPFESKVSLQLYGISGRLVKTLIDERKQPGNYSSTLNTKTLSSGVYFLSLQTEDKRIIERLVVVK